MIVQVTERTIDRHGHHLLVPEVSLEGWWTSLREPPRQVIDRYAKHGTHEQFHSDKFAGSEFGRRQTPVGAALRTSADRFKTDLDLERRPSGKPALSAAEGFDCNDLILHLGMLAYNCLGLAGELAPVRHPAKRRRIKPILSVVEGTVLQMYHAAQFIRKARQRILHFGRICPVLAEFRAVQDDLLTAGRSP